MPFGPYADFNECVIKNGDKSSPEGFCAWLHHKITGTWPAGLSAEKYPPVFWAAYDAEMTKGASEKDAYQKATEAAKTEGWEMSRFGWIKQYQAPKMNKVTGVKVFAAGTWTDSGGTTRDWTIEDLDKMVEAFTAGVPLIVPVKCGHTSDDFNQKVAEALGVPVEVITGDEGQGQIKIGNMVSLERKGDLLVAAFDNVPEPIANLCEGGQYSTVSVEIEDTVGDFGPVITGVALLGAEEPAVDKATLERALVFGGKREGARVLSFTVGDEIPKGELWAEFDDVRSKLNEIVKGKRGAPIFRAMFGNLSELFERLVGKHSASGGKTTDPAEGNSKSKEGGNKPMLPKSIASMKAADIRSLTVKDLVAKFAEGEEPTVDELKDAFQEGELAEVAAALGLGGEASLEDILAAIKGLVEGAAVATEAAGDKAGGEMKKEMQKATDRIVALEATENVRAWEDRTADFNAIPGTVHEHAVSLAGIETKVGKEAAESQFKALEEANRLASDAMKALGTSRKAEATDFDQEVTKYQTEHKDTSKADAIKAVSKARPDLYFARRS